jgi:hypothetical protein
MFTDQMYLPADRIVGAIPQAGTPPRTTTVSYQPLTPEQLTSTALTPPVTPTAPPAQTPGLIPEAQRLVDEQRAKEAEAQLSIDEEQLNILKAQNPLLQQAIDAAKDPNATDQQIAANLDIISAEALRQTALGTAEGRNMAGLLESEASAIAGEAGMTQSASVVDQAASIAGGAFNVAGDIIGLIKSSLESVQAASELTGTMVAGVQNTEDIFGMVDNVQTFINTAAQVAQTVGNVSGMVGNIIGMAGSADPSGGAGAAGGAVAAVGAIAGITAAGLQTVNAAIDIGQEIYRMVGKYAGGVLGNLAGAGMGGLMGDVKFMLDKNTGELISYSTSNSQDKRINGPNSNFNLGYDYRGDAWQSGGEAAVRNELNIYAGPGQSVQETMNETMWLVHAGGTTAGPMNSAGNF